MQNSTNPTRKVTIGLDLGDKYSYFHALDASGEFVDSGRVRTTSTALKKHFSAQEPACVAIEVGTHSPWVSRLLTDCGHEVLVANARQIPLIYQNTKKSDQLDPELLARLARLDPKLLKPIQHRGPEAQASLAALRARDALVRTRTRLVNHVRGAVKSMGGRVVGCSTDNFHNKAPEYIPAELRGVLLPLLETIGDLTTRIRKYDRAIENQLCEKKYPETKVLRQVTGVGPLSALAFVLILEDPRRFKRSRTVGAYLGLVPKRDDSGGQQPQLRITKAGDGYLRRLLVGAAQHILGPFGPDTDLRRHGMALAERGGKNAKKRAIVAVARKLAVLLHRLWLTGEVYEPLRKESRRLKRRVPA